MVEGFTMQDEFFPTEDFFAYPEPAGPPTTAQDVEHGFLHTRVVVDYPGRTAEVREIGLTLFQALRNQQESAGVSQWYPFTGKDEWELAEWLVRRVRKGGIEEFLKLNYV